jgi:hypothetical protein
MSITVDGTPYEIPFISLTRNADFLDKYAERTEDGILHRELIGVYFNYKLTLGSPRNVADIAVYQAFWAKITEAEEFHTVTLPDETLTPYTYTAYVAGVSDELRRSRTTANFWKSLTVNFIAQSPAKIP